MQFYPSQNHHRMVWLGRDLEDHPPVRGRTPSTRPACSVPHSTFPCPRNRASTTSLLQRRLPSSVGIFTTRTQPRPSFGGFPAPGRSLLSSSISPAYRPSPGSIRPAPRAGQRLAPGTPSSRPSRQHGKARYGTAWRGAAQPARARGRPQRPPRSLTLSASSPMRRVLRSWSLRMRKGRPYSSNARVPMADMAAPPAPTAAARAHRPEVAAPAATPPTAPRLRNSHSRALFRGRDLCGAPSGAFWKAPGAGGGAPHGGGEERRELVLNRAEYGRRVRRQRALPGGVRAEEGGQTHAGKSVRGASLRSAFGKVSAPHPFIVKWYGPAL